MRLYSTTGAIQIDDPEYGTFTPNTTGAFDGLPDAMYAKLHGRPGWESEDERARRVAAEELERFRDPAELLKAVKELGANQGLIAQAVASALGLGGAQPPSADAGTSDADPAPADTPPSTESEQAGATESAVNTPPPATSTKRTRKSASASTPPAE